MANFIPVTKTDFADKSWKRRNDFTFAAKDAICPLVVQELPKAQLSLPVAIAYINEAPVPVAVQGLKPDSNVFVDCNGKWIGKYIPAAYRGYPFMLAKTTEENKQILCFDQGSGLISEDGGEAFFGQDGKISPAVQRILDFLIQAQNGRQVTLRLCKILEKKKLIQPWPITLRTDDGNLPVRGLFRVDETAFNALTEESLAEIHRAGALPLIYCQLLSMQHLPALANLVLQVEKQKDVEIPDIDSIFGEGRSDQLFKF